LGCKSGGSSQPSEDPTRVVGHLDLPGIPSSFTTSHLVEQLGRLSGRWTLSPGNKGFEPASREGGTFQPRTPEHGKL